MLGWLFGVGHFTLGNQWIAVAFTFQAAMPIWLGYVAVVVLALYLAVYPALAAWGAWWVAHYANPPRNGGAEGVAEQQRDHPQDGGGVRAGSPDLESSGHPEPAPPPRALRVVPLPVPGRNLLPLILGFAGFWIITEWLRSWVFTGYVWNPLGVIWQSQLELARSAALFGTYGLSAIVVYRRRPYSDVTLPAMVGCNRWRWIFLPSSGSTACRPPLPRQ